MSTSSWSERVSRGSGRLSPPTPVPGPVVRDPRSTARQSGHLGPVPLPRVRSDSDMDSLGYSFKPWNATRRSPTGRRSWPTSATVAEYDIERHIRSTTTSPPRRSTDDARWTVTVDRTEPGGHDREPITYTCSFLFCARAATRTRAGTRGVPRRRPIPGEIVHPQKWPEHLDYAGKAGRGDRIRSDGDDARAGDRRDGRPRDDVAALADVRRLAPRRRRDRQHPPQAAPDKWASTITRQKNIKLREFFYRQTRTRPEKIKNKLLDLTRKELGPQLVDQHFTPDYDPWDQRLCLIPNGDLYQVINAGTASVVTDHIDTFTETGVQLRSAGTSTPTSSSRRPGCSWSRSARSTSRSTAYRSTSPGPGPTKGSPTPMFRTWRRRSVTSTHHGR